ncbi:hypothetical protein [Sphingobium sp. CCH11-B1]|uniref:hypothetical protein n=1 Tax=Sphingobium sp. CCH11-B1 TaxID=1768781 RepID=UPI00082F7422|nr:hypothetical protein [Sphingobium sp. CCH11-B1]
MSNHTLSNGADRAGVVAELRRVAALFQLRAVCAAMEIPFHALPTSEGASPSGAQIDVSNLVHEG